MTSDSASEVQLALALFAPLLVEPTAEVLRCGARARGDRGRGELLFAHRHLPPRPSTVAEDPTWSAMIDLAEEAARSDQPTVAVLDLHPGGRGGYSGVMGHGGLLLDSRGCHFFSSGDHATWARLLAALRTRRGAEPEIARARDLAHAYHALDYYGRVYGDHEEYDSAGWRPEPLIARLALQVLDLGGDPILLTARTDYMRAGVRDAICRRGVNRRAPPTL
jgi:hypothetical protein